MAVKSFQPNSRCASSPRELKFNPASAGRARRPGSPSGPRRRTGCPCRARAISRIRRSRTPGTSICSVMWLATRLRTPAAAPRRASSRCPMLRFSNSALSAVPLMKWHMCTSTSRPAPGPPSPCTARRRRSRRSSRPRPPAESRSIRGWAARASTERAFTLKAVAVDRVAVLQLAHHGPRLRARQLAAARHEHRLAHRQLGARLEVGPEDAVLDEQCSVILRGVRGPVDVELGNLARALVPARHHQADVVEAMVVVQVREEDIRDLTGFTPASSSRW